jgi:hypothetical protein
MNIVAAGENVPSATEESIMIKYNVLKYIRRK